jgi:preprotein translocase subunit SecF
MVPHAWNINIDFIGRMYGILAVSAALIVASLVALFTMGLNFGTDFAGGYEIQVHFPKAETETQIRDILAPMDLQDARVQRFGDEADNEYLIMVRSATATVSDETKRAIKAEVESMAGGPEKVTSWSFAESGESMVVGFADAVTEDQLRGVLKKFDLQVKKVHHGERADRPEYTVEFPSLADDIAATLHKGLGIPEGDEIIKRVDFVGPQVGAELRNQGILAVVYSLLLILLYVAVRFDLFFSPGAVIATLHDVIIVMGVFAVFQIDFNLTVVAAILTLIGYSLNDTIVVYDRIRENLVRLRGRELRALVNSSINETLSRTILTSGTVLLVVVALLVLGGPFIRGFSITMFVGVVVGTYSSIAVASPLYILLREHYGEPAKSHNGGGRAVAA